MDSIVQSAMMTAQQAPLAGAPKPTPFADKADAAAKEYESVFIAQFLGSMFAGIKTDGLTGGGQGEEMFRSLMVDQFSKNIVKRGGFGIADHMKAELLKHQQTPVPAAAQ
jgi:Rod binding domain-containing protein